MFIGFEFISGMMAGIEWLWGPKILVLDLLILRIFIGKLPETEE